MTIQNKINQGTEKQMEEFQEILNGKPIEICESLVNIPLPIVKEILRRVTSAVDNYSVLPTFYEVHKDGLQE